MEKIVFLFFLFQMFEILVAQPVTQEWVAIYNGPANSSDFLSSLCVDKFGNVLITGQSTGIGTYRDYATVKYSSSGIQQWVQRYAGLGASMDIAYSVAADDSGNVYVTGGCYVSTVTVYDYVTIKYNAAGIQQWISVYSGPANSMDYANSISVDGSRNVYVSGISVASETGWDYATVKYNSLGIQQWVQRYNYGNHDEQTALVIDRFSNVYITGRSYGYGTGSDYATIKYNSSGVQQWVQRYNGPGNGDDWANSIAVDSMGNVYVTGESNGVLTFEDYATIKYNSSGVQQWVKRYDGPLHFVDIAHSIGVDSSGNVYVTGEVLDSVTNADYATIKYNSAGEQQWVRKYNSLANLDDEAYSLAVDGSGNVYVTGYVYDGNNANFVTIKYNSTGVQQWIQVYNGNAIARCIAVDGSGNVYVAGYGGTGIDYVTVKYSQQIGVTPLGSGIPEKFALYQNFPNPFNPSTKIKFDVPQVGNAYMRSLQLKIYDVLGREIAVLFDEQLKPGSYEATWDASSYPSGVYFYKLITDEFIETKKMVLIK